MIKINHSVANEGSGNAEVSRTEPYVIFTINNEEFGVEAKKILELVKYMPPFSISNNYHNACGMSVFRGKIIPIVDMRMVFGLEPVAYDHNTVTIMVESSVSDFGIIAERILDINFFPITSIKTVAGFNLGEKIKYLKSIANIEGRLILLLDLEKIIELKQEQAVFEEPAATQIPTQLETPSVFSEEPLRIPEEILSEKPTSDFTGNDPGDLLSIDAMPELTEVQIEPAGEFETGSFTQTEINQMEYGEPSTDVFNPQELEDLLKEIELKPEREKEQPIPDLYIDDSRDGIPEAEQVTEILSGLEAELASALPDNDNLETRPEIGPDPGQMEQRLSGEAITDILKELEAGIQSNIEGTPSDPNNQLLKIEKKETTGESYDD